MLDLLVFEDFQDEGYNFFFEEIYQLFLLLVFLKMEVKFLSLCGLECSYLLVSLFYSFSISEVSYNIYSIDEGFVFEDLSDFDGELV